MLAKTLQVSILSAGLFLVGAQVVRAQDAPAAEATTDAAANTSDSASASDSAPEIDPGTPAEKLARARAVLAQMDGASQSISRMLRDARRVNDVVKTLCLDDKLTQMDVAKRSVQDRVESLEAAVSSGNGDRIEHDFAVVSALTERGSALNADAQQCIGEEKGYVGGSTLEVTTDPTIPQNDTSVLPTPTVISRAPQAASVTF